MNILIVSQYFFPEEFKINDIAFDFVRRGHNVTVLTAKPNYPKGDFYEGYGMFNKKEEYIKGVRVIRTPIIPRKNGGKLFLSLNYISFIFFSFFTYKFRVRGEYDIIFSHLTSPITAALPAIWLKKKFRIPLALWILDLWPESVEATTGIKNKTIMSLLHKLVSYIYNKADIIYGSSKFFKKNIQKKIKNDFPNVKYFPNWAEEVFVSDSKTDFEIPTFPKGFNILFAGNTGKAQDFPSILKAIELTKNRNINWIVVGAGSMLDWLKKEKRKRNLYNMFVLGKYPLEQMPLFFKKADAMLVSLKSDPIFKLTVPAKIQAYMASEKIIVGMISGEAHELINSSKAGIAVHSGNYELLADKVSLLQNMSKKERELMENNAKFYYNKHFKKETLLNLLEKDFMNLISC